MYIILTSWPRNYVSVASIFVLPNNPSNLKGGVIIDGYTPEGALNYSDTVQLGKTVILVCRVSGIPYGVQTSYRWTCPNGTCNIGEGRNPNRKTYNDILIISILSATDGGEYTCEVTTDSCGIIETMYRLNVQVKGIIIIIIKICKYELYNLCIYIHTCVQCIYMCAYIACSLFLFEHKSKVFSTLI